MPRKRQCLASSSNAASSCSKKLKKAEQKQKQEEDVGFNEEEWEDNSIDEVGARLSSAIARSDSKEAKIEKRSSKERSFTKKKTVLYVKNNDDKGKSNSEEEDDEPDCKFLGDPIPAEEAKMRWPKRYQTKPKAKAVGSRNLNSKDNSEEIIQARYHYTQAEVDGIIYNLYDDAHVKGEEGNDDYIGQIVEMFEADDGTLYFTSQWFYRATDTVIKNAYNLNKKRVFFSMIQDDNFLECLVKKLKIVRVPLNEDSEAKKAAISDCDYYCDMRYLLPYATFVKLPLGAKANVTESSSTISTNIDVKELKHDSSEICQNKNSLSKSEVTLLDLYSGCGAMSTGMCLGANLFGTNLVTRWAVDLNENACESLKLNHPETEVRNESVEDFLSLLKEWEKLCIRFSLVKNNDLEKQEVYPFDIENEHDDDVDDDDANDDENDTEDDPEVFEVAKVLQICYGDPNETEKRGLYFKVSWKNYGPEYDTWEPISGLSNCRDAIKDFVTCGYKSKILPLPGDVDAICGGPPCQGISGYNRFRNKENPFEDEKNTQIVLFMDVVNYLKPKFVLMENVVDILKFANGFLGRYALGRLIEMNYQVRMGMMAAGAYGLPQFRMRVFLWGGCPTEKLPQYPFPTHDVVSRGVVPTEFEGNVVAYDEGHPVQLERKLFLEDAISDLPEIENNEWRDEMPYDKDPQTEFQQLIRMRKDELLDSSVKSDKSQHLLYDHRPLKLNNDDYQRVCRIPKRKGANFRDLPGVRVRPDNKVEWDPKVKRVLLDSGKPLVPDYAMSFVEGTSSKPFARLWWDETVPTVVTRAEPHNQALLHPMQDRVLSVRENARLQGFPDFYKLCGPVKERYVQVGNAVAVPVAKALGCALSMAFQGSAGDEPTFTLPKRFTSVSEHLSSESSENA